MTQISSNIGALAAALAAIIVAPAALGQSTGAARSGSTAAPSQAAGQPADAEQPGVARRADVAAGAATAGPASNSAERGDLEERLAAARRRLDEAAREVAELSAERGRSIMRRYSVIAGARARVVIGLQLDIRGDRDGVKVLDVSPGGPAAEAGIRAGDVITSVNGTVVKGDDAARRIVRIIRDVRPESKVHIRALREGKKLDFTVTARPGPEFWVFNGAQAPGADFRFFDGPAPAARPGRPAPPAPPAEPSRPFGPFPAPDLRFLMRGPLADMELATLTPGLGSYFGTDKGVLVLRAPADGALKLEDGDVILSIDGRVPESGAHATRILASYQPGEKITLEIMRHRKAQKIATTMPADGYRDRNALFLRRGAVDLPQPSRRMLMLRDAGSPAEI